MFPTLLDAAVAQQVCDIMVPPTEVADGPADPLASRPAAFVSAAGRSSSPSVLPRGAAAPRWHPWMRYHAS